MHYRAPLSMVLVVIVLTLIGAGLAVWQFVSIKSIGHPLGAPARLPAHIGQLIQTTERYLPSLHRNPGKDRFRIDLLVVSLTDPNRQETFPLLRQQQSNALQPMTTILGAQGDVVWVQALDLFAVNLKTKRIFNGADLRKQIPELSSFLDSARFQFTTQLIAVSPDWRQAYAISGETLRASACEPPPRPSGMAALTNVSADATLCSGGLINPHTWFGALAAHELASGFKPGVSLPREFPPGSKREARRLYRGTIDAAASRPRIVSMDPVAEATYQEAAMLRRAPQGEWLHLSTPDSVLLLHRVGSALFAPWQLDRVTFDGTVAWSTATGIGRVHHILPDPRMVALVGERPPVPDQVPEPILVLIDATDGATKTVSLWR